MQQRHQCSELGFFDITGKRYYAVFYICFYTIVGFEHIVHCILKRFVG